MSSRTQTSLIRLTAATAVVGLALTGGADASAANETSQTQQIVPLVEPAVVYEVITYRGSVYDDVNHGYLREKPFVVQFQCSGFVVNSDGYVATAGHCVDPSVGKEALREEAARWALENYYKYPELLSVDDVIGDYRIDSETAAGRVQRNQVDQIVNVSWGASVSGIDVQKSRPARVVDFQTPKQGDAALLKVEESGLNAIELGDASDVEINSDITAIGYPGIIDTYTDPDLTPTFQPGTVSSQKTIGDGLLTVLQLSAQLTGGMSGGPTVDSDGNVIGIISSGFPGEAITYAVPVDRIRELMAGAGVENVVSETTQQYRAGIRAYFAGDRETAMAALAAVLDEQPANGPAEEFLAKAKDLPVPPKPASEGEAGLGRWALVAGGGTAAVIAVLVAAVVVTRRRSEADGALSSLGDTPAYDPATGLAPLPGAFTPLDGNSQPMDDRLPVAVGMGLNGTSTGHSPAPHGDGSGLPEGNAYCTTCGSHIPPATTFCGRCGTKRTTG